MQKKLLTNFFLTNISHATFPRRKWKSSCQFITIAERSEVIYRSVSQFALFTVRSVRAFLTRLGERAMTSSVVCSYEWNERLSCEIYSIGARLPGGMKLFFARPRVLVYYIRICGNSYTVANQSNRNNCHALATQKMHYNALRNVRAISIEREFMAHRDRILGRSLGLIFARTTESNLRNG